MTRPEVAAARTAQRLADAGFLPVLFPVSRTVALDFDMPVLSFEALAVTSASAFRHITPQRLAPYKTLPLFAVGEGTARAAREAGFAQVIEGGGDAVRLAATMARSLPEGAKVLYLAGRVRQPIFEEHIARAGLDMTVRDVYDARPVDYSSAEIHAIAGKGPFVAVLLYSGLAARIFVETMRKIEPPFDAQTRFLCISGRVADQLLPQWRAQALVADHPDEEGIFRLFSKL